MLIPIILYYIKFIKKYLANFYNITKNIEILT